MGAAALVLHGPRELMLLDAGEEGVETLSGGRLVTMRWQVVGHLAEHRGPCIVRQLLHAIVPQRCVILR